MCLLLGVRSLHSQWSRHKYTSCFVGGIFTNIRCLPQTPKKQFWVLYGSWISSPLFCHHMFTTTKQSSCIWSWTPNICNCHKLFESQEKTQKINQKKEKKFNCLSHLKVIRKNTYPNNNRYCSSPNGFGTPTLNYFFLNALWHIKYHFSTFSTEIIKLFIFLTCMRERVNFSSILMHTTHLLHFLFACAFMNSCLPIRSNMPLRWNCSHNCMK